MSERLREFLASEVQPCFTGGKSYMVIRTDLPEEVREELESLGVDCRLSALSESSDAIVLSAEECAILDIQPETEEEGRARCLGYSYKRIT